MLGNIRNVLLVQSLRDEHDLICKDRLNGIIQSTNIINIEGFKPVAILTKGIKQFWIITHRLNFSRCISAWKLNGKTTTFQFKIKPLQISSGWDHVTIHVINLIADAIDGQVILMAICK